MPVRRIAKIVRGRQFGPPHHHRISCRHRLGPVVAADAPRPKRRRLWLRLDPSGGGWAGSPSRKQASLRQAPPADGRERSVSADQGSVPW